MAIRPVSLPPTAISGVMTALLRPTPRVDPVDSAARAQTDLRAIVSNQAVVVQFGARALGLARSVPGDPGAAIIESFDADDPNDDGDSGGDDLEALLARAFDRDEADAALLGAFDAHAQRPRPRTPGAFEREPSANESYQDALESGFPRTPRAPSRESLLGGQAFENGLESAFPRPPLGDGPETELSAFANDELESFFPRSLANASPSGSYYPAPTAIRESGVFRSANAGADSGFPSLTELEFEFPRARPANDLAAPRTGSPRDPGTEDTLSSPPAAGLTSDLPVGRTAAAESTFARPFAADGSSSSAAALAGGTGTVGARGPLSPPSPLDANTRNIYRASSPIDGGGGAEARQQREVQTLERNARELRADERAQRAAAAGYANGVQLRHQIGPDGRRYVVESDVSFDLTPVAGDPAATLRKMEAISRAASSGTHSVSDRHAAAEAEQLARQARAQLAAERYAAAREL